MEEDFFLPPDVTKALLLAIARSRASCRDPSCDQEARRAGYIALGMGLLGAAMISVQVPVMPTSVFLFAALFCFIQLSNAIKYRALKNHAAHVTLSLWRRATELPRCLRVTILMGAAFTDLMLLSIAPRSFLLGELAIDLLLSVGLILFVGPKRLRIELPVMARE